MRSSILIRFLLSWYFFKTLIVFHIKIPKFLLEGLDVFIFFRLNIYLGQRYIALINFLSNFWLDIVLSLKSGMILFRILQRITYQLYS